MHARVGPGGHVVRRVLLYGCLLLATACGWAGTTTGESGRMPGAPTGVTAGAGSATSVHVMWNAVSAADGVRAYEVYRGGSRVVEVPASEHMVDVTRLSPATAYVFTVRARDGAGRLGPPSREVRATTPAAAAADDTPPTRPGALTGRAAGSRAAQLSWSAATDDRAVVSYDVYQGDSKIHTVSGAQTATVLTGLRPGTAYSFTVRARDAADNLSPAAGPVRLTTPGSDDGRATAPTGLSAGSHRAGGVYYLDLSWVPPRADGVVTEYEIQLDGRAATSLVWGGSAPQERASYSFYAGREAGVTHRVRLRAKLPDGTWGGFTPERSVTTGR
ncbi:MULTISPECIES: fibronectin type III domain-containing protein [unclassified Streptomyces]|uniref:fibronectin type III domain-containing protein n=1 Tax=unclassified Streptomyces TaxID=2593676 RepID=UPI001F03BB14|nr:MULTISPECIES: fibronectin type III domain-containing protein [unclassified Streptomyces]MCH0562283.1 fibronectin type III domain-containing protein [Streptomyces sp. MUM 2J]MCH0573259.1 fibronectin type III domain-containing protein [Streptomyces sp. MUM 136J]